MAKKKSKSAGKGSAGQNRKNSEDFINKYHQKSDVISTASGLMYRIIDSPINSPNTHNSSDNSTDTSTNNRAISQQKPTDFDQVEVHQRLLLSDGTVIADTYKTNTPEKFSVEEAIDGLTEGLQYMQLGDRFEFVLPPELAWGKKGNNSKIGANAVLVMDIRLLSIF